jgi:hypothetical protein
VEVLWRIQVGSCKFHTANANTRRESTSLESSKESGILYLRWCSLSQILWCDFQKTRLLPHSFTPGKTTFQLVCVCHADRLQPQRCLTYVKDNYPESKLEAAALECSKAIFDLNSDISKPDEMRACLSRVTGLDVEKIMEAAASPPVKAKLLDMTSKALAAGAYGCPWFEVTNGQGTKEPFFGSDRYACLSKL